MAISDEAGGGCAACRQGVVGCFCWLSSEREEVVPMRCCYVYVSHKTSCSNRFRTLNGNAWALAACLAARSSTSLW